VCHWRLARQCASSPVKHGRTSRPWHPARATIGEFDGLRVPMISLPDLRQNKKASGRPKDLLDLDHLPEPNHTHRFC